MKLGQAAKFARGDEWIVPRYMEHLRQEPDMAADRDVLYQILSRPKRVRTGTFSASGANTCLRKRQLQYLGLLGGNYFPDSTLNILANGDYVHLRHQVAGLRAGYLTEVEVPLVHSELNLTGTADGVTTEGEFVEYKSINDYGFESVCTYGPKADHLCQVNSYMFLGSFTHARIVYENKNTQRLKEFHVEIDLHEVDRIVRDLERMAEAIDQHRMIDPMPRCREQLKKEAGRARYRCECMSVRNRDVTWPEET